MKEKNHAITLSLFAALAILFLGISGCSSGAAINSVSNYLNSNSTASAPTPTPAPLASIAVTPSPGEANIGQTQQFTAMGTYGDGTQEDITNSVLWTSSDTAIATVDAAGLATAIAAGQVTITATYVFSSITGTATFTVKNPIVSVKITELMQIRTIID
jgi:uncharacterized protein YjdB